MTSSLNAVLAFGRWWRAELAGMLPPWLRRQGPRVLLDLRGAAPFVARSGRGSWQPLGPLPPQGRALRALAAEARLVLAVPPEWVLHRVIRLPEAAEARLDNVLAFEIEQHIPFPTDAVLWSAQVLRRLPDQQRIDVAVAILPRHLVTPAVAALRAAGITVPLVAQPDPGADWPCLSLDALAPPRRRWRAWAEPALAAAAVVLAVHLGLDGLRQRDAEVTALEARAASARQAAEAVLALDTRAAALRSRLALAVELRGARPATVALLEEVARRLPDDVWLSEWRLTGDQLTIAGFAARTDGLLGALHASPMLREVRFAAPVTRDRRDAVERFQVALRVVQPADIVRTANR